MGNILADILTDNKGYNVTNIMLPILTHHAKL